VQLWIKDIAKAPGNIYNSIQNQIFIFIIIDALQSAYPATINGIFKSNTKLKYPHMPEINILPSIKTMHVNLGPIIESKASISGNYYILKTIFLE